MAEDLRGPRNVDPTSLGNVEAFLFDVLSDLEAEQDTASGRGRPRILPGLCLWAGLLVCVLHGCSSQLAIWRRLTRLGLWHFPRFTLSGQAVYKRLASGGTEELEQLFATISRLLADRLAPWLSQLGPPLAPFASAVVAIDETTLDPVVRRLPDEQGKLAPRRIPGKLAGIFDLRSQQWRTITIHPEAHQNEKVLARELAATLPPGSLLVADLGYFAFRWFDDVTDAGMYWVSRLRKGTSYTVVATFHEAGDTFDGLITLGKYRADRGKHTVRLVCFRHGNQIRSYITNVLEPERMSMAEIARLYARRWDIEMAVQLVKQHLGARLWWSDKDVVIHQQLLAVLIIAQIVQALRVEIAARAGVDLFEVSLPLLVEYLPQFAANGEDPVEAFVAHGRAAGFIRPSRRIVLELPDLPAYSGHIPDDLQLQRRPRYAQRTCGPRPPSSLMN